MEIPSCAWLRHYWQRCLIMTAWLSVCIFLLYNEFCRFRHDPKYYYVHQILGTWLCLSRGSAAILNVNCGLILLPMCRCCLTILRSCNAKIKMSTINILLDSSKGFHVAASVVIVISTVIHLVGHTFNYLNFSRHYNRVYIGVNAASYPHQDPMLIALGSVAGVTGYLMCLILVVILSTSFRYMRERNYNLFFYTHRLIIFFYILLLVHGHGGSIKEQTNVSEHWPGCNTTYNLTDGLPELMEPFPEPSVISHNSSSCSAEPKFKPVEAKCWLWIGIPLVVYILDSGFRFVRRNKSTVAVEGMMSYPGDVVELKLQCDGFSSIPGQYVLLRCPGISFFEWHPFTITKCPDKDSRVFSLHVRSAGDWSGKLKSNVDSNDKSDMRLKASIDGPYSSPLCQMNQSKLAVCISGGIGVTPFIALLNTLRHNRAKLKKLERLYFIWINRNLDNISWFIDTIIKTHNSLWTDNKIDLLELHFYITRETTMLNSKELSEKESYFIKKRLKFTKPDWSGIFSYLSSIHKERTIDIFVCGPRSMVHDVKKHSLRQYNSATNFRFYQETF